MPNKRDNNTNHVKAFLQDNCSALELLSISDNEDINDYIQCIYEMPDAEDSRIFYVLSRLVLSLQNCDKDTTEYSMLQDLICDLSATIAWLYDV